MSTYQCWDLVCGLPAGGGSLGLCTCMKILPGWYDPNHY